MGEEVPGATITGKGAMNTKINSREKAEKEGRVVSWYSSGW